MLFACATIVAPLHEVFLKAQDEHLEDISSSLHRLNEVAVAINVEVDEQNKYGNCVGSLALRGFCFIITALCRRVQDAG
jgi:hypothetical protein